MSQKCTQQTRIDQFYKIISNKNTGCGLKFNEKFKHKKHNQVKIGKRKLKRKDPMGMSSLVECDVQIIEEKIQKNMNSDLDCENDFNSSSQKRSGPELQMTPKKQKLESSLPHNKTSLKERSPNDSIDNDLSNLSSQPLIENKIPLEKNDLSPKKSYFTDRINIEIVQQAIENLNLVRQGSIDLNEFDLETIYQEQDFSIPLNDNITLNSQEFELKDIIYPRDKHADHLLMTVMNVFSNRMNCGYFYRDELNLIFSLFTLSSESQMLFVRLLKRKLSWHRTSSIKYPEISNDLNPFFTELIQNKFCISDLESIDTLDLLNMLFADEVRSMCQKLKIDHKGNKEVLISKLLKYGNNSKSFFRGAKSPKSVLRSMALSILQLCVCLPKDIINLFDRVLTLLHPVQDPSESIADLFLTLNYVHYGEILYPPLLKMSLFPIFQNRSHLISFIESKNAYKEILIAGEKKEWDTVRDLGNLALEQLLKINAKLEDSSLPLHIKKFEPVYHWMKVLSRSVEAFKKSPETIPQAVKILKTLIEKKNLSQSSCGRWYSELALIEMHHRKDLESSAVLTLNALQQSTLTEVDISDLMERLRKLMRRKNGISEQTKLLIKKAQEDIQNKGLTHEPTITKTISASMANKIGSTGKSKWSVTVDGSDKYYGSVEVLALQHYTQEENFKEGLHCEGSLPIILFTVFFWDELYNTFVPGAFVSRYQDAPLDLFTAQFFPNRKKIVEDKISFIRALDSESFADWMQERFSDYIQYKSVMPNTLFKTDEQFKDVVTCLGINGVIGICEKLLSNFRLWRAGFPDLILWNASIPKCKIVEVKGPGDTLSEKQKLWLNYLESLEIDVEVCHVEALGRSSK